MSGAPLLTAACATGVAGVAGPDYEQITVCDTATNTIHVITSSIDAGVVTQIGDLDTGFPCASVSDSVNVTTKCLCDDQGGGVVVSFVRAYTQVVSTAGVLTPPVEIGNGFTDETLMTPYTVVGTEVDCSTIGSNALIRTRGPIVVAAGSSVTLPPLTQSYSVRRTNDGAGVAATVTHADGSVDQVLDDISYGWTVEGGNQFLDSSVVIAANADDLTISYTYLTA